MGRRYRHEVHHISRKEREDRAFGMLIIAGGCVLFCTFLGAVSFGWVGAGVGFIGGAALAAKMFGD